MRRDIFINKKHGKTTSPEQLNDYIKVANPAVWMVLAAVLLLLAGVFVWAVFSNVDTTMNVVGTCQDGRMTCYIPAEKIEEITSDSKIKIEEETYLIHEIDSTPIKAEDSLSEYLLYRNHYSKDDFLCRVDAKSNLPDGDYSAKILIRRVSPISFILNQQDGSIEGEMDESELN